MQMSQLRHIKDLDTCWVLLPVFLEDLYFFLGYMRCRLQARALKVGLEWYRYHGGRGSRTLNQARHPSQAIN